MWQTQVQGSNIAAGQQQGAFEAVVPSTFGFGGTPLDPAAEAQRADVRGLIAGGPGTPGVALTPDVLPALDGGGVVPQEVQDILSSLGDGQYRFNGALWNVVGGVVTSAQ